MPKILSLDPGVSTGWSCAVYDDTKPLAILGHGVIEGGITGFLRWFPNWIADNAPDEVLSETFVIDGTLAPGDSLQIEGAAMALWSDTITWQTRSDKAALIRGEKERNAWLRERFPEVKSQHSLDAVAHLCVLAKRREHMPSLRKYWA